MNEWVSHDGARNLDTALQSGREPDRSLEVSILGQFERHGQMEGAILESYRKVAERSSAGEGIRYLVRLILEDEERHHDLFAKMANEIRSILWEIPVEPRLPAIKTLSDPELLAETKRLLSFEKRDAKELRALRKSLKSSATYSLDPLMVELMLHDTAKHIAILEYIRAHLTR